MKGKLQSILMVALLLATALPAWSADKSDKSESKSYSKSKDSTATTSKTMRDDRAAAAARGKVDINTADKASLEALPGIGPVIAQEIIDARPFKSVNDLKNIKGIGDKRFADILPHVTISGASGKPASATSESSASRPRTREAQEAKDRETGSTISNSKSTKRSDQPAQRAAQPTKE